MLQRAIYVSDATGEAGSNLLSLVQILGAAEANNRRDHLTGVLLVHGGQFLQAIEGRRTDLDRLIRRLKADPRHSNLRFLVDGPAEGRDHGEAPMVRLQLNAEAHEILGDDALSDLDPTRAEALLHAAATNAAAA